MTYPGLVHFVHFDKGIMTAPRLVDLNDLDKNHELLHEVYGRYNAAITDRCKWVWPNEPTLKKLVIQTNTHQLKYYCQLMSLTLVQ